jgi:ring-1,2-phenylacetyl-CoA epoxidase subunit PaaC
MTKQEALFQYALRIGDSSLILGHRLSEWCGHGPILEQDIALINVSLDLIGQSRTMLQYAGEVEGKGRSEDDLAYLRLEAEYCNPILMELPNGHFGNTMARQFFADAFNYFFYIELQKSADKMLADFAAKSIKEVAYHLKHSTDWILRLGDGTAESHQKITEAIEDVWMYTGEMFDMDEVDQILIEAGIAVDLNKIKELWKDKVTAVLKEATLEIPDFDAWMISGGKTGKHSEHLGFLLTELQYMQRAYPNMEW